MSSQGEKKSWHSVIINFNNKTIKTSTSNLVFTLLRTSALVFYSYTIFNIMTDKCIICLEELHTNIGVITPCGHCFHRQCFNEMKKSTTENNNNSMNDDCNSGKLPRCPVCKRKSKKFVDIYLTFEEREYTKRRSDSDDSHHGDDDTGDERGCSASAYADATQALASLTSENMRLRRTLQEVKSVSKDQGELLLNVLPRFDELQSQLAKTTKAKEGIEKELREVEEENSELLTGWNNIEMKMQMVKIEKEELEEKLRETKRKNDDLNQKWNELDLKYTKARKKRKMLVSKQANELKDVKFQITKSKMEKDELCGMLKKAQMKSLSLKRMIKKLKRKQCKEQNRNARMKILG